MALDPSSTRGIRCPSVANWFFQHCAAQGLDQRSVRSHDSDSPPLWTGALNPDPANSRGLAGEAELPDVEERIFQQTGPDTSVDSKMDEVALEKWWVLELLNASEQTFQTGMPDLLDDPADESTLPETGAQTSRISCRRGQH